MKTFCLVDASASTDVKVHPYEYNVGEWVWVYNPRRKAGRYIKWQKQYYGPFLITDKIGPVTYAVQRSQKAQAQIVHRDKLKLYRGDTPKSWLIYQTQD